MRTLIRNCRVLSPGRDEPDASLLLEDGKIARLPASGPSLREDAGLAAYDAGGAWVLPGFIDVHVHGAAGRDVTDGSAEAVEAVARAKLAEGVTTFCPTTLTLPEPDLDRALRAISEYAARPTFAKVAGVHLEGPFIHVSHAGAQNARHIRKPDKAELLRLAALAHIAVVTYAIEEDEDLSFLRTLVSAGIVPSCGHSGATYAQFVRARAAGLRHLTHLCNQMSPLNHREIGLTGAGLLDDGVLVEVICDKIHLCPEMISLIFKCKPRDKIALITDAICASGLSDGDYQLGGLAVRVRGGEARLARSGDLAGSVLPFPRALRNAHEITGSPLRDLVRVTSLNQAEALGLEGLGKIEEGYRADLVVLDDAFQVRAVFVDGRKAIG